MENKTELNCPHCNQRVRIPSAKHLNFTCPSCNNQFEIDGRPKQKSSINYKWIFMGVLVGLVISGYKYYTNLKANQISGNSNIQVAPHQNTLDSQVTNEFDNNLNTLVGAVDISNEITNDFAVRLASKFPGKYNIGQICQIYDYLVKNWKYVNDSDKMENFRSASRTINNNFAGDCDDFAILIAAMIESIGGDTRISLAYNDEGGHAFTEVLATENKENMQAIVDEINE
ncbi:MAG: transglutaminase domain-containing protein, partial [Bacteroidota bacterium]